MEYTEKIDGLSTIQQYSNLSSSSDLGNGVEISFFSEESGRRVEISFQKLPYLSVEEEDESASQQYIGGLYDVIDVTRNNQSGRSCSC